MNNPWKDYKFNFWHTTDGVAICYKKAPNTFTHLVVKLAQYGVYRYSYSYADLASTEGDNRIRVVRASFDKLSLTGDKKPSFISDDETLFHNVKLRLWRDAIQPLVIVTTPELHNAAFCLLAITPDGLWRCAGNGNEVVPVDEHGRVRVIRDTCPGISN